MRFVFAIGVVAAAVFAAPAFASGPLSDLDIKNVKLAVNTKGEALLTYNRSNGQLRHVLVWGAVNALPPSPEVPQVRFKWDYAGGWGKYHKLYWKTFEDACHPYDGPVLPYFVTGCKSPD